MDTVSLRYFNIFGPRQDPNSQYAAVLPRFIRLIGAGQPVTINGDGEQSRDFTFIENVVQANLLAADAPSTGGAILNIATGEAETVGRAATLIGELLGKPVERIFAPAQVADVRASLADITVARTLLGYEPSVSFGDGLQRTIASLDKEE